MNIAPEINIIQIIIIWIILISGVTMSSTNASAFHVVTPQFL